MKKILLTLFLLIVFPVLASHIVGGEFELLHLSGNNYQLNMILYFDLINGNPGAQDDSVAASVWRKSDNKHMEDFELYLTSITPVGYTQPACSHGEIKTNKLFYTANITLSDSMYNDPKGYYISWQRCCRNYTITNIYSDDPATSSLNAGQTFYLEFPPVVKNGLPFYNSSPRLFPPLNDYACPGRPYYVNFTGTDDDQDSLVYTMTTPLNTFSAEPLPEEAPGPYKEVRWRPGYSLQRIIGGNPDLSITLDGLLRCTPGSQGLYVFAVKIEQYRDKQKIGESRRDFQMLVTDVCAHDSPPQIVGKKAGDATFNTTGSITLSLAPGDPSTARCIDIQITDPDSQSAIDSYTENVGIRLVSKTLTTAQLDQILPGVHTAMLVRGSAFNFQICFEPCPLMKSGTYDVGIIAYDDACSLPETDTLKVTVHIIVPPNTPPHFVTPTGLLSTTLNEGDQQSWPFEVVDPDGDSIVLSTFGQGFNVDSTGVKVTVLTNVKGRITGTVTWYAYCDIYDFIKQTHFLVQLLADDVEYCSTDLPVAASFDLTVVLPGIAPVLIDTDLTPAATERRVDGLKRKYGDALVFNVRGTQADNNLLQLSALGNGFTLTDYNMTFPNASANGAVTSQYSWTPSCDDGVDIRKKSLFSTNFIVLDNKNKCRIPVRDTVEVSVTVLPPDSAPPNLVIASLNDIPIVNNAVSIRLGQAISLNLIGTSIDPFPPPNSLQVSLISAKGNVPPVEYVFNDATGVRTVTAPFLWHPDCKIFQPPVFSNEYVFTFNVLDKACYATLGDTVELHVTIADIDQDFAKFLPSNVITPNGDNCNDYFAVDGLDDDAGAISACHRSENADNVVALPHDNCYAQFQYVNIFNRWGKEVFKSTDRKFRWYAQNADAGVYYYMIAFGNTKFKGSLSVRP